MRTLVPGRRLRRGTVTYTWNGRDDQGRFVAQGVYKPRVHLADQHRTIDLPNEMQVDTTAPRISIASLAPRTISPTATAATTASSDRVQDQRAGTRDPVRRRAARGLHARAARSARPLDWNGEDRREGRAARRLPRCGSAPRTAPVTPPTARSSVSSCATSKLSRDRDRGEGRHSFRRAGLGRRDACAGGSARAGERPRRGCSSCARPRSRGDTGWSCPCPAAPTLRR